MNIRRWFALVLLFSAAAVVSFAVPVSLAYIAASSETIVNTFESPYFTPASTQTEVRVIKTIRSAGHSTIGPEGFCFTLVCNETGVSHQLITDETGAASVILPFTSNDLNNTYTYQLAEINDGRASIIYDARIYEIEISLSVNEANQMIASLKVDGEAVEQIAAAFENIYTAGIALPNTGDSSRLSLCLLLFAASSAAAVMLAGKKESVKL